MSAGAFILEEKWKENSTLNFHIQKYGHCVCCSSFRRAADDDSTGVPTLMTGRVTTIQGPKGSNNNNNNPNTSTTLLQRSEEKNDDI